MELSPFSFSKKALNGIHFWRSTLLAAAATLGFGYLVLSGIDTAAILQSISRISAWTITSAVSLFLVAVTLRITRWWLLMRHFQKELRFSICAKPFLLSIAANDFMPVRIGDLVKVFANQEAISVPPSTRLGTVIVERLFDVISILLFFFLGALQLDIPAFEKFMPAAYGALGLAVSALLLILLCSKVAERWIHTLLKLRLLRKRKLLQNAKEWNSQFFQTFSSFRGKTLTSLFLLSCVIWGIEGTMALTLAWAIDPTIGGLGPYLSLACGALSNFLPSAPGMLGTLDYFLTLGVIGYGMPKASAAAFALLVHSIFLGFSAIIAIILLSQQTTWNTLRGCFHKTPSHTQP
jgi:glycosyltransferase 2 family protein